MLGGGAGHIFDMIARLKANNSLIRGKNYFQAMKDYTSYNLTAKLKFKKATKAELEAIKQRMAEQKDINNRKMVIAFALTILITSILIWLFTDLALWIFWSD